MGVARARVIAMCARVSRFCASSSPGSMARQRRAARLVADRARDCGPSRNRSRARCHGWRQLSRGDARGVSWCHRRDRSRSARRAVRSSPRICPALLSLYKRAGGVSPVASSAEVSGYLVGSTAFKAAGTSDPRPAGSIPVHLRQTSRTLVRTWSESWSESATACGVAVRGSMYLP